MAQFSKALSNQQKCKSCGNTIPKDVDRVSFYVGNSNGGSTAVRVCGYCILKLAKKVDKKPIKEWMKTLVVEVL